MRGARFEEEWSTRALGAGFVAVGVMTVVFLLGYVVALVIASRGGLGVLTTWFTALAYNQLTQAASDWLVLAVAVHLAFGLAWALVYAAFFARRLPGPGWRRGMLFSLLPWLLSLLVFFPAVGAGVFGLALGAGPLPVLGNLILHLAYGATLGALYDLPIAEAGEPGEQRRAMLAAEHGIIGGLLVGLVLGGAVGALLALALPMASLIALVVGGATAGGALGVVAGSLIGLSRSGVTSEQAPSRQQAG
ncbi:MAG: hypothetical protein KatS3mg061_2609 [Dehalococcoidia bacterium]|nr:MAG: hypothetical protein KatS3mg061_2609 [Dehalococcoidia bacterium]